MVAYRIHSPRRKEVSQSEIKISIIFFLLELLVRPSIHLYTKMSIFNVKVRCKYLSVLRFDIQQIINKFIRKILKSRSNVKQISMQIQIGPVRDLTKSSLR